jgi:hypothetical protein
MKRTHLLILVCLLVAPATVAAQPNQVKKPETAKPAAKATPEKDPEAERLRRERRAQAQSLLISLATDAGSFNNQSVRARTQARIADALWETDPDRARALFRKAWEAAEIADAEGERRMQEEAREQQAKSGGGGYVVASPPEIRKEVLRLAVKHETSLGDEFLERLKEKTPEPSQNNRNTFQEKDAAAAQRLGVARELLAEGDMDRALQFATPVLNTVSMQTIDFLSSLREKNAAAADERYAAMLAMAAANPQSSPNTASFLSSYLFTPHMYVMFAGAGSGTSQMGPNTGPIEVAPALRTGFFRVASEILIRPIDPGQDQTNGNVITRYYVIRRLLPLFEQFANPELTAGLRGHLDALASMLSEDQRQSQDGPVRQGISPQKPSDREHSLLDRIDRAKTSAERDQLYFELALSRAGAGDLLARDYADKIDDTELRHGVRGYVDASLAMRAIEKKDAERALEIVRTGELTHIQKVWTLTRAAKLLAKTDRERALQVIDDATAEVRRMEGSDPDRPRAFLSVANVLLEVDSPRGWDLMNDAVKAANAAPTFTGEDGELTFRIMTKSARSITQHSVPDFDVAGVFQLLANQDYEKAVELARVFEREAPRANAVIAIALAVLEEKKK